MTISEMLTRFTTSKRATGASDKTVKWYRSTVKALDTWLQQQPDQTLTTELMETYIVSMRDRKLAPASVRSNFVAIHQFFGWCKAKKLIDESPTAGIKVDRAKAKEPRRATRTETKALIDSIPVNDWIGLRDYLAIHVIFFCGLRVGELVRLEGHHFDLEQRMLYVPDGKTGAGVVPLLHDVIEAFLAYEMHRPKGYTDRLFVSADGHRRPLGTLTESGIRTMIERRCKEAGIRRLNPHAFRHGLAMHMLNDLRADVSLVQRILRHSDVKTTTTFYARWLQDEMLDEYRQRMEGS